MRILIVLSLLGFAFVTLSQALAQEPGDIGTVECRKAQLQIQNTIEMQGPYENHGQLVKAVVHLVKSARKAKIITGKCASCIFMQFALWIPREKQDACGPDIETEACCFPDGCCEDMTPEDCTAIEAIPQDAGTDCATVSCSVIETVACCFPGNICKDMTQEDCDEEKGIPMQSGSNCDTVYCGSAY